MAFQNPFILNRQRVYREYTNGLCTTTATATPRGYITWGEGYAHIFHWASCYWNNIVTFRGHGDSRTRYNKINDY